MQTTQQFVISKPEGALVVWCPACGDHVAMVTVEQAALMSGLTSRTIYRSAESGLLHFSETSDGLLTICLNSLTGKEDGQ